MTIKELREARKAKALEARNLVEKNTGDAWTAEIETQYNAMIADIDRMDSEIERNQKILDLAAKEIHDGQEKEKAKRITMDEGKPVYARFGEQLVDVAAMAKGEASPEQVNKLMAVQNAATGMSTGSPSGGGFLVQKDFSTSLMEKGMAAATIAPKCMKISIGDGSDGLEAPYVDETSRATGSRWGGVRVYRRAEAETVTASSPKLGKWSCDLEDLMAVCYVTGRALRDASALGSIVQQGFQEEFSFTIDDEVLRGSGAGQCAGIIGHAATVEQAKETGQDADTVVAENIDKMWARMPARYRVGSEWYINQEIEPELSKMFYAAGTGGVPVYLPPNGLSGLPYGTIKGRPVIPVEQCSALGDAGDIILANFGQYILIDKDNLDAQQSMHVRFLYDEMCFRFLYRINGKPKWKTVLTPYKGSNTLSPFVTLAARA